MHVWILVFRINLYLVQYIATETLVLMLSKNLKKKKKRNNLNKWLS
jgi:hypothetical protein